MIRVGINGLGRIGKCVLLQVLDNPLFDIKAINVTKLKAEDLEDYLSFDSAHGKRSIQVNVLSPSHVLINKKHEISLVSERDPSKIDWISLGVDYLIDCTGAFLTEEKCKAHNAPFTIISSPAKDKMPTFIYGVNHEKYNGEKVVSGSSCTTNCLAPMVSLLDQWYGIRECVFTTIHAATASQYVTDVIQKGVRTDRSIFNNIIPHTTGASSSVTAVMPHLKGKVFGTSVRVPVSNCSLVDLNVTLERNTVDLSSIKEIVESSAFHNTVFGVTNKNRVSSDYMTTETPCNLDLSGSIDMGNGKFKLFLWYDNEWSYSAQLLRMVQTMFERNQNKKNANFFSHYVENMILENKVVVCRFDYNVPVNENKEIVDDFRMTSTLETIHSIFSQGAKSLVIASHFGRPKGVDKKYSTNFMVPHLQKLIGYIVDFLPEGVSLESVERIQKGERKVYLLENIRFHEEETLYETEPEKCLEFASIYAQLGDVFISDAFGCAHRKHFSVHGISTLGKPFGFGCLIEKEVANLLSLTQMENKKVLGIIGGNKIKDKLPIIDTLKHLNNSFVFVAGGLARQYERKHEDSNVLVMQDGIGHEGEKDQIEYVEDISKSSLPVYDIGTTSMQKLLIKVFDSDVIFWNGSLGKIEDPRFRHGSENLVDYLLTEDCRDKQIIIGGGETASLFQGKSKSNIYVSTGGGALLEFLQNSVYHKKTLVGIDIFYEN